ncbi:MAG TPA: hypothetical protein VGM46_09980 [Mesorhizobium sp.]
MIRPAKSRLVLSLAGVAMAVALATGAQPAATRNAPLGDLDGAMTDAQEMFSDAPDGVDPMVTGPVSASFKVKQADAGCGKAVWPNVPAGCYPN